MCLLVVKGFGGLVACVNTENDAILCLSTWVTLCPNISECVHIKIPPVFYRVCLRSFGALSGWHIPNINCVMFMIMEYRCDDASDHE